MSVTTLQDDIVALRSVLTSWGKLLIAVQKCEDFYCTACDALWREMGRGTPIGSGRVFLERRYGLGSTHEVLSTDEAAEKAGIVHEPTNANTRILKKMLCTDPLILERLRDKLAVLQVRASRLA